MVRSRLNDDRKFPQIPDKREGKIREDNMVIVEKFCRTCSLASNVFLFASPMSQDGARTLIMSARWPEAFTTSACFNGIASVAPASSTLRCCQAF